MLELEYDKQHRRIDLEHYQNAIGGETNLIRDYWERVENALTSDRDLVRAVLFALSTERQLRRPLHIRAISRATQSPTADVGSILAQLVAAKLVRVSDQEYYEWSHDYLASSYYDYSATEMEPALRDSVSHLINNGSPDSRGAPRTIADADAVAARRRRFKIVYAAGLGVLFLCAVLSARLPIAREEALFGVEQAAVPPYWPGAIAHLIWSIYLFKITADYIIRVNDPFWLLPWWLIPLVGIANIVATALMPGYWLVALGVSGLVIGIKYWAGSLLFDRRRHLGARIARTGLYFVMGSIVMIAVGFALWTSVYYNQLLRSSSWGVSLTSFLVSAGLVVWGWTFIEQHTSAQNVLISLGLFERDAGLTAQTDY